MAEAKSILNQTFDDVPEDVELPEGEYVFEIMNAEYQKDDAERELYNLKLRAIEVTEAKGISNDDLANTYPIRDRMWMHTGPALKRAKNILQDVIGVELDGRAIPEVFEDILGMQVRAVVKHETGKNGQTYVNVDRYLRP